MVELKRAKLSTKLVLESMTSSKQFIHTTNHPSALTSTNTCTYTGPSARACAWANMHHRQNGRLERLHLSHISIQLTSH